jgi:hypothetical protein
VNSAEDGIRKLPVADHLADNLDEKLKIALNGAVKLVFRPAVASASIQRRVNKLQKRHPEVGRDSLFLELDLKAIDRGRPSQLLPATGAAGSVVASLAVTGAEVSTTVSGGATAGVVLLAIAADVSASLALLGRAIAEVAVHYGYDPREPEEEIFLMGVLSYSTAASLEGKTVALASLSRLTQQMMRRAAWKELEKDVVVKVIQVVFNRIGIKLTHKRLAQVVPVVGGVVSAGLSYDMLNRALQDATRIYRVRYLSDKYDVSFEEWTRQAEANLGAKLSSDQAPPEDPIDIEVVVLDALDERQGPAATRI